MMEWRQARLLVIDDDPTVRSVLHDLLIWLGYVVDDAPGGAEGLALFGHGSYDLVLTDLAMPGMSGWDVAEAVLSMSTTTPVILVTGSATDLDAQRAGDLGVTILHKPVPLKELRTAVQQALAPAAGEV
jgi:two-component system, NarL family, capsular synthesis sensor histidine kinase RcsC